MSCGCAKRMREYVLPEAGFNLQGDRWVGPEGAEVLDSEVEEHHTKLMLKNRNLRKAAGRAAARTLLSKIGVPT